MSTASHLRWSAAALVAAGAVVLGGAGGATAVSQTSEPRLDVSVLDAGQQPAQQDPTRTVDPGLYIVTLVDPPAAAYDGGEDGFPATRARGGHRFDRTRPVVAAYARHLTDQQDQVLSRIGNPATAYRFTTALNGFAATLTGKQVKTLRSDPRVALVEKSTKQRLDTVSSPDFLGMDDAWASNGGPEDAGAGVVVGVVDSGIWPENPSFADVPNSPEQVPGFHGTCQAGEQWDARDCNDKVVSARYFVKGFGRQNVARSEYLSPRDGSGHGSHTASTAAGNHDVDVEIDDQDFGRASGMAPAARIAAYKVCWAAPNPDDDGCATADAVAAIDQAVADGVDVINYSISGARNTLADSVELAFLNASASGVFVAASAGNSGPDAGTVAHPSPWVTTVAASTHHLFQGAVVLGDDEQTRLVGAMVSDKAVSDAPLVLAGDAPAEGSTPQAAAICEIGSLDASLVENAIVVCDRGSTPRVDKSAAVARAGGAGMVLANVTPDGVESDFHSVPTVHVDVAAGEAIKRYAGAAGDEATASIDPAGSDDTAVPQVASFSSRGPSAAVAGDLLKPDVSAPGVSVLAAVAPPSDSGRLWDLFSGTSMSAPHVAGMAAFIKGEKPTWTPAQVKSAMVTTADDVQGSTGPFAEGAGNIDPREFLDPGLVFDADTGDYLDFLAGQGFTYGDRAAVSDHPIGAGDLNLPSIAVGRLTGTTEVVRRVTNVSSTTETFDPVVTGMAGVDVTVRPRRLTLSPGESHRFTVSFQVGEAASPGNFAKGALTWTGLDHQVRVPMVVRPQLVDVPDEVAGTGATGSLRVNGTAGTADDIALTAEGLVSAMPTGVTLVPGAFDSSAPTADTDTLAVPVEIDPGTDLARFQMDAHNAADDMDMFVYRGGELVGQSAGSSADETVTLVQPEPGDYTVYVNSYSAANRSTTTGQFYSWVVGPDDPGNMTITPDTVAPGSGQRFSYDISWSGLDAYRWLGVIRYGDSDHRTLITID